MRFIIFIFLLLFILPQSLLSQCDCQDCPVDVPNNFNISSFIEVSGLSNSQLGTGGQGICEISVYFTSDAIDELTFTLISPNGTEVDLFLETGLGINQNLTFDISFFPCSEPVFPDPGFPDNFDTSNNWINGSTYTGSYYPDSDCLEDFFGPANGTWTLFMSDDQAGDASQLLDWEIIFCDDSGLSCTSQSCDIDFWSIVLDPSVFCEGDIIDLTNNVYTGTEPDPNIYGYTTLIYTTETNDVIEITDSPDLSQYASGEYDVCTFTYLLTDASLLPDPGGGYSLASVENDINNEVYCAVLQCNTLTIGTNAPDVIMDWDAIDVLCAGQDYVFNVENFDADFNYLASISSGGFNTFIFNNGVLTLNLSSGPLDICVFVEEDCQDTPDCKVFDVISGFQAPQLNDFTLICIENQFQVLVLDNPPAAEYSWSVTGDGVIDENNNTDIFVSPTNTGSMTICAFAISDECGDGPETCFDVEVIDPAPPIINTDLSVCVPGGFVTGIQNDPANSVEWSVISGPGNFTFFNSFTLNTSYTVDVPGQYQIQLTENNLGCVRSATVVIEVLDELVYTSDVLCENGEFVITLTFNNGSPPYFVFGNEITGNVYISPAYTSGSAVLTPFNDNNGCEGQFFVQEFCDCESFAGTMDQSIIEFCGESGIAIGIFNNDAFFDFDDAGIFILHTSPNGDLGTVIDQNDTGSFSFQPPMILGQTYYISYVVGSSTNGIIDLNDACLSVSIGQPVVWNVPIISEIDVLNDTDPCDLFITLTALITNGTGIDIDHEWLILNAPAGGSGIISTPFNQSSDFEFTIPGEYTIQYNGIGGGCTFTDEFTLTIEETFAIETVTIECLMEGTVYNVTIVINEGSTPVTINGENYNGTSYISDEILSGDSYVFEVSDGCINELVQGNTLCPCESDAGTMETAPIELCEGQNAQGEHNNDETLDSNDDYIYILHTSSTNSLGSIFDQNSSGEFSFLPNMIFGQTYFISYVVGTSLGGMVNLNDPCLSVSIGQPVTWYQNPIIDLGDNTETCETSLILSAFVIPDINGLWSIITSPAGSSPLIVNENSQSTEVVFDIPGEYTFNYLLDNNGCTSEEQIIVTISPPIEIGLIEEECQGLEYTVSFDIVSGESPFFINGVVINSSSYTSDPILSGDSYNFTITDINGCELTDIEGVKNCNCESDAGTLQQNLLSICGEGEIPAITNNDSNLDSDDIGLYVLHDNGGPTLGNILNINDTGIFSFIPGMSLNTVYYISFVVANDDGNGNLDFNDLCLDVANGQPVIWYSEPSSSLNSFYQTCDFFLSIANSEVGNDFFDINIDVLVGPAGSSITSEILNDSLYIEFSDSGLYGLEVELDNGNCISSDTIQIEISDFKVQNINYLCDSLSTNYSASIQLNGGTSPYIVNGESINSDFFTIDNLISGDTILLSVIDDNDCRILNIEITNICNCNTPSHIMSNQPLESCDTTEIFTAVLLDQGQISDEDKGFFVLHTSATDSLGEVLFINTNGNFDASGLVLDSTYFISFVSGDSLLSGDLDLLDPCLSVSYGQPIIYYSTPSLFAGDNIAVCGLEIILNGFIDNNDSIEWNILDQPIGSNPIINDKNDINTSLSTDIPGDYQIRLSSFSGNCISLDTVLVTFYDELQVEIIETECSINNDFYTVSFNIMGGVAPYLVDGIETNGMNFTSSPIPSNTSYSFEIRDNSPCSQLILEGIKDCSCPSQPGQLDNELIELCAGENFIINYMITPVLDSGYEALFVLHNGTNSTIGDVFQIINGSLLVFDGTIPLNQSLLLSPLVGPLNGQGIDFDDSCTLLGLGTPIIWYENIDIQLQTPSTVCIDEFFDIEIQINSPFYPLNIILSGPGINQPLVVGSNQTLSFELSINTSGKFEILGVGNECIDISSILSSDIEVENCDCEVYSFNSLDSICVTQNLIDLTLWNFQNAQGDWTINSFTGQNSPELSDTELDLTSSTSGILNLSFTPSSELSCDSVYLFDLYIEAPVNTSLVENYINFCNSETDIIDLNNYLINGQVGEWVGYTSLPMEVFFEGKINLNLLSPGIYDFEYLTNQSNGICNNDQLILTAEITEELEYVLTTFDPICFGETGGFFIDILNSSVDISNVTLNGESLDFLGNSELIAGNYNLIITDINECQSFENFEINQSSELLINLQSSNINNNVTVFASFNKPAANLDLSWFVNNEELGSQNDLKLELSITEDTEVILEAVDQNGCIKRESVFVPYEIELFVKEIVFPNIFNPTSGAGNNIFSIPENESISIVESFQIFDRWGQIIFEASNYSPNETTIGWDGKKGSENASEGVYVFYLKYFDNNGDIKIHAGDITLIR